MADNSVFITGVASGAFEKAFADLPDWATEETLVAIAKNLKKNIPIQTQALRDIVRELKGRGGNGGGAGGKSKDPKTAQSEKEFAKWIKESAAAGAKKQKQDKEREEWDKKQLLGVKEFTSKWDALARGLMFAKAIGDKVLAVDSQYLKTMENLSDSGVSVYDATNKTKDGMEVLNQVVNLTGIRLENLEAAMTKYTDTLSAVGIQKFGKAVGEAKTGMGKLGFNVTETIDMMGAYVSMESNYTDMRKKSSYELSAELETFGKGVRDNMQAFGKSREEILANAKALSKSTDAFASNAILGTEATKRATASLMGMPEDIAQGLMKSSALAGQGLQVGFDNIVNDFASSGSRFTTQMNSLVKALPNESPEQIRARFQSMTSSPMWQQEVQRQQLLAVSGDQHAASSLRTMQSIQQMVDTTSQATKEQKDAATGSAATVANLRNEQEKLAASIQAAFYPAESQIKAVTGAMEMLNKAIYGLIGTISGSTRADIGGVAAGVGLAAGGALTGLGMYGTGKAVKGLFGKGASTAGKVGVEGAEIAAGAGGLAAKGGGKMLGKLIPGVGLAFGIYDAINRASKGDYVGAGLAGVSGIASLFPGIGTVVAAGLDVANIARDYNSPSPSTINSPSAVPANPANVANDPNSPSPDTNQPSGSGMDRASSGSSINTLMMQQNSLTQQVIEKLDKLHKDNDTLIGLTRTRT